MIERIGRPSHHACPEKQEPGGERGRADQHDEGVVVDIAGLQPTAPRVTSSTRAAMPSGPSPSMIMLSPIFQNRRASQHAPGARR